MASLDGLNCLRCGSEEEPLATHKLKKRFMFAGGRQFGYTIPASYNSFNFPVCIDCNNKLKRFKIIFSIIRVISILWVAIPLNLVLYVLITKDRNVWPLIIPFFNNMFVFFVFLDIIVFLLASDLRVKNIAKIGLKDFTPFIRPNNSNKWVIFTYWVQFRRANLNYNDPSSLKEYNKPSNIITWGLPYIGGLMCLFATIIPFNLQTTYGMVNLLFPNLITYLMYIALDEIFGIIFFLIVLYISSYLLLKNANQLKKAKILVKGIDLNILINSVILLLTALYFFYIYGFESINIYFILIGSILSIIGVIIQKIK